MFRTQSSGVLHRAGGALWAGADAGAAGKWSRFMTLKRPRCTKGQRSDFLWVLGLNRWTEFHLQLLLDMLKVTVVASALQMLKPAGAKKTVVLY